VSMSEIGSIGIGVELPARLTEAWDIAFVRELAEADTAEVKLPHVTVLPTAAPATSHFSRGELRRALRLRDLSRGSHKAKLVLLRCAFLRVLARKFRHGYILVTCSAEGEAELLHEHAPSFCIPGSHGEDNFQTVNLLHFVRTDFREGQVLLEAERVVPLAIEGLGRNAAEVSDAGERNIDELIEELVHPTTTQGHLRPDHHPLPNLEGRNRLLRFREHWLLPANTGNRRNNGFLELGILDAVPETNIYGYLGHARYGVRVGYLQGLLQRRDDLAAVLFEESRLLGNHTVNGV